MALLNLLIVMLCGNILSQLNRFHGLLCKFLYVHLFASFPGKMYLALSLYEC